MTRGQARCHRGGSHGGRCRGFVTIGTRPCRSAGSGLAIGARTALTVGRIISLPFRLYCPGIMLRLCGNGVSGDRAGVLDGCSVLSSCGVLSGCSVFSCRSTSSSCGVSNGYSISSGGSAGGTRDCGSSVWGWGSSIWCSGSSAGPRHARRALHGFEQALRHVVAVLALQFGLQAVERHPVFGQVRVGLFGPAERVGQGQA